MLSLLCHFNPLTKFGKIYIYYDILKKRNLNTLILIDLDHLQTYNFYTQNYQEIL